MSTKIAEIPENTQVADSDADRKSPEKASVGAHKPRVAPTKAKSAKKATPAKKGRIAPKPAKLAKSVAGVGEGSKTAPVAKRRADVARVDVLERRPARRAGADHGRAGAVDLDVLDVHVGDVVLVLDGEVGDQRFGGQQQAGDAGAVLQRAAGHFHGVHNAGFAEIA